MLKYGSEADRYILTVLKCLEFGSFVSKSFDWFIICSSKAYKSFHDLVLSQALHLITSFLQPVVQSCWASFSSSLLLQSLSLLSIYFCSLLLPLIFWPPFWLINLHFIIYAIASRESLLTNFLCGVPHSPLLALHLHIFHT